MTCEGRGPVGLGLHRAVLADVAVAVAGDVVDLPQAPADLPEEVVEGVLGQAPDGAEIGVPGSRSISR